MQDLLEQLQQLMPLAAAATPGPWTWDFRPQSHTISLMSGYDTVLDTMRWGTQGATIRMRDPENLSLLLPLHKDAVPHGGRAHHKGWALTINPARTDAAFIAAARNLLTPDNLALLCAAPAPQWVPVSERLPEIHIVNEGHWCEAHESDLVLAVVDGQTSEQLHYCNKKGQWRAAGLEFYGNYEQVTHWMPLPAAPATMEGSPAHV